MENKHIPLDLLCTQYNIEVSFITSLTEYGLLEIVTIEKIQYLEEEKIKDLEKLIQLHYELDINMEGLDAISHVLHRVENLQSELTVLKNKLRLYERE